MPAWLLWLTPVLCAPLLAVGWTAWTSRTRRPVAVEDSLRDYQRFRRALQAPVPSQRTRRERVRH